MLDITPRSHSLLFKHLAADWRRSTRPPVLVGMHDFGAAAESTALVASPAGMRSRMSWLAMTPLMPVAVLEATHLSPRCKRSVRRLH